VEQGPNVPTALRLARDFEGGLALADSLSGGPQMDQTGWESADLIRGEFLWLTGRAQEARAPLQRTREELAVLLRDEPQDPRLHAALGLTLALLGNASEAVTAGRKAVELVPPGRDAMDAGVWVLSLAGIQAIAGRRADAVASLNRYLGMPGYYGTAFLAADPRFDSLREDPAFRELLARYGAP
jgi:Flp pilus assembly protein TadD